MAVILKDLPKVLDISHNVEPLWASDAGRNSNSGKYSGTFIGWFDNLTISIGKTTQSEFETICSSIETSIINATFPDTRNSLSAKTEDFYGTTITGKIKKLNNGCYEPFSFSLKAISKRSDM